MNWLKKCITFVSVAFLIASHPQTRAIEPLTEMTSEATPRLLSYENGGITLNFIPILNFIKGHPGNCILGTALAGVLGTLYYRKACNEQASARKLLLEKINEIVRLRPPNPRAQFQATLEAIALKCYSLPFISTRIASLNPYYYQLKRHINTFLDSIDDRRGHVFGASQTPEALKDHIEKFVLGLFII